MAESDFERCPACGDIVRGDSSSRKMCLLTRDGLAIEVCVRCNDEIVSNERGVRCQGVHAAFERKRLQEQTELLKPTLDSKLTPASAVLSGEHTSHETLKELSDAKRELAQKLADLRELCMKHEGAVGESVAEFIERQAKLLADCKKFHSGEYNNRMELQDEVHDLKNSLDDKNHLLREVRAVLKELGLQEGERITEFVKKLVAAKNYPKPTKPGEFVIRPVMSATFAGKERRLRGMVAMDARELLDKAGILPRGNAPGCAGYSKDADSTPAMPEGTEIYETVVDLTDKVKEAGLFLPDGPTTAAGAGLACAANRAKEKKDAALQVGIEAMRKELDKLREVDRLAMFTMDHLGVGGTGESLHARIEDYVSCAEDAQKTADAKIAVLEKRLVDTTAMTDAEHKTFEALKEGLRPLGIELGTTPLHTMSHAMGLLMRDVDQLSKRVNKAEAEAREANGSRDAWETRYVETLRDVKAAQGGAQKIRAELDETVKSQETWRIRSMEKERLANTLQKWLDKAEIDRNQFRAELTKLAEWHAAQAGILMLSPLGIVEEIKRFLTNLIETKDIAETEGYRYWKEKVGNYGSELSDIRDLVECGWKQSGDVTQGVRDVLERLRTLEEEDVGELLNRICKAISWLKNAETVVREAYLDYQKLPRSATGVKDKAIETLRGAVKILQTVGHSSEWNSAVDTGRCPCGGKVNTEMPETDGDTYYRCQECEKEIRH